MRQVGEAGNAHAMRKSTDNRRFDEIGREERKRDGHIDLADAAPLAFRKCLGYDRRGRRRSFSLANAELYRAVNHATAGD